MSHNPIDNICTVDYKTAEDRGYFKLDFPNVIIYKDVKDETHLTSPMRKEPSWELLETGLPTKFFVSGLSDPIETIEVHPVEQLAATLAIALSAQRHSANEDWKTILEEVWINPTNGEYYFKKAHALSYAVACVVHMNLICENQVSFPIN